MSAFVCRILFKKCELPLAKDSEASFTSTTISQVYLSILGY